MLLLCSTGSLSIHSPLSVPVLLACQLSLFIPVTCHYSPSEYTWLFSYSHHAGEASATSTSFSSSQLLKQSLAVCPVWPSTHCAAQAGLKFMILMLEPLECWVCRVHHQAWPSSSSSPLLSQHLVPCGSSLLPTLTVHHSLLLPSLS